MNRLTKQIGLVLISSSLILHGCERSLTEEETKKKEEEQTAAAAAGTGTGATHGYHPGVSPFYYGGSRYPSGTTGASHFSGTSTSSGSRSGAGVSTRGGFGATAHGVSS